MDKILKAQKYKNCGHKTRRDDVHIVSTKGVSQKND